MGIVKAVVRIERATKKPALFYWSNGDLMCYTMAEQHATATYEYYRKCTYAPGPRREDVVQRLINHYTLVCSRHHEMLVIGKRLTRK